MDWMSYARAATATEVSSDDDKPIGAGRASVEAVPAPADDSDEPEWLKGYVVRLRQIMHEFSALTRIL